MKIKIITIEITQTTEDLRPDAVPGVNGKKKMLKEGHKIMGYAEVVQPFLDAGVAKALEGNPLIEKVKKSKSKKAE